DASVGEVPVGQQRDQRSRAAGPGQLTEHVTAAGQRDDPHAQSLTERDELVEQLLGLEPFGNCGDGGQLGRGPRTGDVPVAEMPQEHDHGPARLQVVTDCVHADHPDPVDQLIDAAIGKAEGVAPVAQVGAHSGAHEGIELSGGELGPNGRVVAAHPLDALAPTHPGDIGHDVEHLIGEAPRHPADEGPPAAVADECRTLSEARERDKISQPAHAVSNAWRRTSNIRWPTVIRLATASRASTTASSTSGAPSPTSPVASSTVTTRSARSAMPTLAVMPSPSARALA